MIRYAKDSWKLTSTSTYKADLSGAFEEVLFSDGVRLRSDALFVDRKKLKRVEQISQAGDHRLNGNSGRLRLIAYVPVSFITSRQRRVLRSV